MKAHAWKVLSVAALSLVSLNAWAADWETDFGKATTNAVKTGQYLLLDFSGSDWCGWCMKLDKEVFSKPEFKTYAAKNLTCVLLDFPRQKKQSAKIKTQNKRLAEQYGIQGYPSVILLSPKGDLVGRTGYQEGGAKAYVAHLQGMIDDYKKQHPDEAPAKQPTSGVATNAALK